MSTGCVRVPGRAAMRFRRGRPGGDGPWPSHAQPRRCPDLQPVPAHRGNESSTRWCRPTSTTPRAGLPCWSPRSRLVPVTGATAYATETDYGVVLADRVVWLPKDMLGEHFGRLTDAQRDQVVNQIVAVLQGS
jgi:mRNA-degrading endonuclease toxin of MazEF toxin-antitoxin module